MGDGESSEKRRKRKKVDGGKEEVGEKGKKKKEPDWKFVFFSSPVLYQSFVVEETSERRSEPSLWSD